MTAKTVTIFAALVSLCISFGANAQAVQQTKGNFEDKFRQLDEVWPTPGGARVASGAPGHAYWQQRVDYRINVTLDAEDKRIAGQATVTYHNNSPDALDYLWVQLDQNIFDRHSWADDSETPSNASRLTFSEFRRLTGRDGFDGGYDITSVRDSSGADLPTTTDDTMMRIDLPQPLAPGAAVAFSMDWTFQVPEAEVFDSRSGYETFPDDGGEIYEIAQWYPRLATYTDTAGWNNKQFLGTGEFDLEFGDFDVSITVPGTHVVAATGVLANAEEVLTEDQRRRLGDARNADQPVYIVTAKEASASTKRRARGTRTWRFTAKNVRDFAFASSSKFIWDAMGHQRGDGGEPVMAMSFYPEEASPLWDQYSTEAVVHTLEVFGKHLFPYPYPVAQSVSGPVTGMEYPMITFNPYRPERNEDDDPTYARATKYGLISVIIHEIGHQYFPMIVNSDERRWAWLDEGLTSFMQFITEQAWEADYPSRRGPAEKALQYMTRPNQTPIMTEADSALGLGSNAYVKPAVALNILRETVLGRELFDFAFAEYGHRWQFKRATPVDFFRTMEDASGVDLDWFWRGWFYSTDHVDIALANVIRARIDTQNPDAEKKIARAKAEDANKQIWQQRNAKADTRVEARRGLKDFYDENDEYTVTDSQREDYQSLLNRLDDWQVDLLKRDDNIYFIVLKNIGGLVMPVILAIEYDDGSSEELRIPAEIWRYDTRRAVKMLVTKKEIAEITLDPHLETADAERRNNHWPRQFEPGTLELYKPEGERNLMRQMREDRDEGR